MDTTKRAALAFTLFVAIPAAVGWLFHRLPAWGFYIFAPVVAFVLIWLIIYASTRERDDGR